MVSYGGVWCCVGAYAFYLIRCYSERRADELRSVTRVNGLKDLAHLLDTGSKVVSVFGNVGSDTPLKCEDSQLSAVILEETVNVLLMKRTDAGHWGQTSKKVFSKTKEVPWFVDDGTGKVYVVGAQYARGFEFTFTNEVFEKGLSLVNVAADRLQDLKILGLKRVQSVLPVGTSLTVVGEAIKDKFGKIQIRSPEEGPFYVSQKSIDELISELVHKSRLTHYVSVGLLGFGVYLLARPVIESVLGIKRSSYKKSTKLRGKEEESRNLQPEEGLVQGQDLPGDSQVHRIGCDQLHEESDR